MPRVLRLQPLSLALGAVGCGLALYLASAAPLAGPMTLRIDGIPAVSQMIRLDATDLPYTVPVGTSFVITGVGLKSKCGSTGAEVGILLDGVEVVGVSLTSGFTGIYQVLWPGVVAPEGTVVGICGKDNYLDSVFLGYLARN